MESPKFSSQEVNIKEESINLSPITAESSVEKPSENFAEFRAQEDKLTDSFIKKAGDKLKAASLAILMFAGTSSAYGEEIAKGDAAEIESRTGPVIVNNIATPEPYKKSEMEKMFSRLSISLGDSSEKRKPFDGEEIGPWGHEDIIRSSFFKDLTRDQYAHAINGFAMGLINSTNAAEYFGSLKKENFSTQEKIIVLQAIGLNLQITYNTDMLRSGTHVEISDDAIFNAIHSQYTGTPATSGICGNNHTFLTKAAMGMGMESWLQGVSNADGAHIISGIVIDDKEIAFLDSAYLIRTGTMNYKDALGVAERVLGKVRIFGSYAQQIGGKGFSAQSRAGELAGNFANIKDTQKILENELGAGAVIGNLNGVEVGIGKEVKKLGLTSDHVSVSFSRFENTSDNPYQSLKSLNAGRVGFSANGEEAGIDVGVAAMHFTLKDIYNNTTDFSAVVPSVFGSYIKKLNLTKGEYGALSANLGATLQAAIKMPLDRGEKLGGLSGIGETAIGGRIIYIDPKETGKFYVGASELLRSEISDFQTQREIISKVSQQFNVGAQIDVQKGSILNLDAMKINADWGTKFGAKAGFKNNDVGVELAYEKDKSNQDRFIPSGSTTSASVSYKMNPKYTFQITGFEKNEQYKGGPSQKEYGARVSAVINIF